MATKNDDSAAPVEDKGTAGNDTAAGSQDPNKVTTGIGGTAFPEDTEVKLSDQTATQTTVDGYEYEAPKFVAVYTETGVGISPFGWVGPEALTIVKDDLKDFQAFVAAL